jgi:tRNA(Ile)-lysidine synthase
MGLKALPIRDGSRVLLACSGGADSLGMLALFLSALPRPHVALGLAHVHHNLRGREADRDEAAVHQLASALGLPFYSLRLSGGPARGQSREEWARERRYAALEELRADEGWDWVATAHSLDDQAETLLIRMHRGCGLDGLAGILPVSSRVVRPVLELSRAELREAAEACGFRPLQDSSNLSRRYLRNRLRLDALPALEAALPGLSRQLAALARRARLANPGLRAPEVAAVEGDTLYYPCETLIRLGEGAGLAALRQGLLTYRGDLRRIGERHLKALWALAVASPGATVALPGRLEGVREKGRVSVRPSAGKRRHRHEARAGHPVHRAADPSAGG